MDYLSQLYYRQMYKMDYPPELSHRHMYKMVICLSYLTDRCIKWIAAASITAHGRHSTQRSELHCRNKMLIELPTYSGTENKLSKNVTSKSSLSPNVTTLKYILA
jgi:hypothetical protein